MKVFDAHCHIYPAKIARKAAQTTAAFYNYTGETLDGTVQTLFAHGGGITKFLVQSVATRPDQVQHINEFIAREVAQFPDRLYGFGALHPDSPTLEEDIAHLRALGLHGVKLHPDIQGFRLDDPRCFALAEQCEGVLPLLLHTETAAMTSPTQTALSRCCGDSRAIDGHRRAFRRLSRSGGGRAAACRTL